MPTVAAAFSTRSSWPRGLARWGARLLTASFFLTTLVEIEKTGHGLFADLDRELWDATACAAVAPRWFSVGLILTAYLLIRGALWSAVGESLVGGMPPSSIESRHLLVALRPRINMIWRSQGFRPTRRRMLRAAFIVPAVSGSASVVVAAWFLRGQSWRAPMLTWIAIVASTAMLAWVEGRAGADRLVEVPPSPTPIEAEKRLVDYLERFPAEVRSGAPLMYAYSGRDRGEMFAEMAQIAMKGAGSRAARWGQILLVAVLLPLTPAPPVDQFSGDGFVGCSYTTAYGFFGLAQGHLALTTLAVAILLAVCPWAVLWSYVRLMRRWSIPPRVQAEVLRREGGFARRNSIYQAVSAVMMAVALTLILWLSAGVAVLAGSPVAGYSVLVVAGLVAYAAVRRSHRRFASQG